MTDLVKANSAVAAGAKAAGNTGGGTAIGSNTRVYRKHQQIGGTLETRVSPSSTVSAMVYGGQRDNQQYQQLGGGRVVTINRDFSGLDVKWAHQARWGDMPVSLVAGMNYDRMEDIRQQNNAAAGVIGALTRDDSQRVRNFDQYVQGTIEPSSSWLVVAGLRNTSVRFELANRYASTPVTTGSGTLNYASTNPVIGVTYRVSPSVNLYANFGKGFETPTTVEVSYTGNPLVAPTTGPNLSIQPSISKNYEGGVKALVSEHTRLNAALYRIDTEREIVQDQGSGTTASFKNAGRTRRQGLELSFDSELPQNFALYGAMTWSSASFVDAFSTVVSGTAFNIAAGNRIPGTYRRTAYGELSWRHAGSGFHSALETIQFSDTYTNDTNVQKADGYGILNLRAGFTQKFGGWTLREFARIENLNNRRYVSSVRVNAAQNTTGAAFEPGAPRNWMIGFSASHRF